jgi:putative transferase (TIGR04331 family)
MFLATTSNQDYWNKDKKILFLGEWCKLYSQKHVWQNLQHQTLSYHWDYRGKLYQDYLYCESVYEKYLEQLVEKLNKINGVEYSSRYWRIVIGPWLFTFVSSIYDKYLSVRAAIDSKLVTETWLSPSFNPEQWICANYCTFVEQSLFDENYHLYIFSKIIHKLQQIPFEIKGAPLKFEKVSPASFDRSESFLYRPESFLMETVKKTLRFCVKYIPDRLNGVVFANSYLARADLFSLQLSLGQIPYPSIPRISSVPSFPNFKIRCNLKSSNVESEFESLLDDLLFEHIPTCYVEDYVNTNQKSLENFSKAPKVIFTANFIMTEELKFWMASHAEKGVKLVVSQHGGGYGSHMWSYHESHEIKISDHYFSWGWKEKGFSNISPMASGKLSRTKKQIKSNPKGSILWVTFSTSIYSRIHISTMIGADYLSYFSNQECFLRSVSKEVHELLLLRLSWLEFGWREYERWQDIDSSLNCYQGGQSQTMYQQLNESRICITTCNSTVYLETFSANFPTLLFWDPKKMEEARESAQPYFDDLRRVGILHDTPESAAKLLNEIYEDPMSWWSSSEIQEVRKNFCHQFARTSNEWLSQWKEELLKIAGSSKS